LHIAFAVVKNEEDFDPLSAAKPRKVAWQIILSTEKRTASCSIYPVIFAFCKLNNLPLEKPLLTNNTVSSVLQSCWRVSALTTSGGSRGAYETSSCSRYVAVWTAVLAPSVWFTFIITRFTIIVTRWLR
jgi:hypothetical protein